MGTDYGGGEPDGARDPESSWPFGPVHSIGTQAKRDGIVINTVALMQPNAADDLDELAKRTGGGFTVVQQGGKVVKKR